MDKVKPPIRSDFLTRKIGVLNVGVLVAADFGLFGALIAMSRYGSLWLEIPIGLILSVAHQKYVSEWIHEAAHYNLFPNRRWNDIFINMLGGALFVNDIRVHRFGHFKHHASRSFFVQSDPDTYFLKIRSRGDLWRAVLSDISGLTAIRMFFLPQSAGNLKQPTEEPKRSWQFFLAFLSVQSLIIFGLIWMESPEVYFIYYASMVFIYPLVNRIRVYGQHIEFIEPNAIRFENSSASRTIVGGWFDRFFISSHLMAYHNEHHELPSLPYRALAQMNRTTSDDNKFAKSRWPLLVEAYRRAL